MNTRITHRLSALALLAAMAALAGPAIAQTQEAWGRVLSATPVAESTAHTTYNVTYEYEGRRYTTRTDEHPGSHILLEVGSYGVATTSPVAPQRQLAPHPVDPVEPMDPVDSAQSRDWDHVTPEPGVVVSGGAAPAPVYVQPAPIYYPTPVYVQPTYAYPRPYVYPPIGLSLNLGYSRGWGRGWHGGGHGHWRR